MQVGRVAQSVVAPTKHPALTGAKLLLVQFDDGSPAVLAIDTLGAGIGSSVIVATGDHPARIAAPTMPTDAVIVGLLD